MAAVMRSALAPDPFHSGEMAMQKLAGLREEVEAAGEAAFPAAFAPKLATSPRSVAPQRDAPLLVMKDCQDQQSPYVCD